MFRSTEWISDKIEGCIPSGGFNRESVSLPFLLTSGQPHSLAPGPAFPSYEMLGLSHTAISLVPTLIVIVLSSTFRDSCDNIGNIRLIQDNLILSWMISNLNLSAVVTLCHVTMYLQVPGIKMWTLWGASVLPTMQFALSSEV